ncbi:hypothetical protein BCF74_10485 [Knoellia remsis]|uniref:Uncharacterized protein n=1 Tax=Knoellia remsis TaxID=407159 RepID=A0A2T0UXI7_9MICO|nr:hypothetical protein [Knoellia remsis]PRY62649.1 hypothetical protein BCF74_10485 [Knoellia remsis]
MEGDAEARLDAAVGSVAEEAARLLQALGRAPSEAPAAEPAPAVGEAAEPHEHVAMGDAEACSWCPVCRAVVIVRGLSPETLTRLADVATAAATVLGDLATRHTDTAREGDATTRRPAAATPTEPITVVDEEETS